MTLGLGLAVALRCTTPFALGEVRCSFKGAQANGLRP